MANTSLNLGEHWEVFIKSEVASGRYGSASEVYGMPCAILKNTRPGSTH